jgi:manganese/zinc/iron transport system substrate-binding protein
MKHALVLFALVAVVACGAPQEMADEATTGKLTVVATTTIVADAVRQIAGDSVEVVALMGAGVDPHLYKPSAGDVRRLSSADAVFLNGLHLEGKMGEVLEQIGERGVSSFPIAECIAEDQLIVVEEGAKTHDPHAWFDVALWTGAVTCVAEALAELDPDNVPFYAERRQAYVAELNALDAEVRAAVATIPEDQRVLVTAHDAFAYFGRAYGLEVRGLLGISTAAEAGAADVQDLADFIAERKIPAVFVESSVPRRTIDALREAVAARGHEVAMGGELYSDALGSPGTPAETFVGTVRANVSTIVSALGGEIAP